MEKVKILFLAANPEGTQQLWWDEEHRSIEQETQLSEHRDSIELITKLAVQFDDLQRCLDKDQPQIVHYCGRYAQNAEILPRQ